MTFTFDDQIQLRVDHIESKLDLTATVLNELRDQVQETIDRGKAQIRTDALRAAAQLHSSVIESTIVRSGTADAVEKQMVSSMLETAKHFARWLETGER